MKNNAIGLGWVLIVSILVIALPAAACTAAQPLQAESPDGEPAGGPYPGATVPAPTLAPYPAAPSFPVDAASPLLTSYDWTPQPGDENLTRGGVDIQESGIMASQASAGVAALYISGILPDPCHKLRALVSQPDSQGQIQVEVYSVSDPNELCTQVLAPFSAEIPLKGYVTGQTTVLVNGEPLP